MLYKNALKVSIPADRLRAKACFWSTCFISFCKSQNFLDTRVLLSLSGRVTLWMCYIPEVRWNSLIMDHERSTSIRSDDGYISDFIYIIVCAVANTLLNIMSGDIMIFSILNVLCCLIDSGQYFGSVFVCRNKINAKE